MLKPIKLFAVGSAAALVGLLFAANVQAATATHNQVQVDNVIIVMAGQNAAFVAGVKNVDQCLSQHADKYAMHVYASVTGDRGVYNAVSDPMSWADMDAMDRDRTCDSVFESDVMPHIAHGKTILLVRMPGFSHVQKNQGFVHLVDAVSFTLKDGEAANKTFKKDIKEIYAAAAKTNWPYYSVTYNVEAGGRHAPDYLIAEATKNWADFGAPANPTTMKMLTNVYGKNKAKEIMKSLRGAVKHASDKVYHYEASLSYTPSSH
ncbi:MAG: hypothetical protein ACRES9_04145 [Gammaproteobacteria bacterium]